MTTSPETSQRPSAATAQAEIPTGSHASEAQRDQKETTTANAPSDPRTGALAGAGHSGLFRQSCRADQCPGTQRLLLPYSAPLAAYAAAPTGSRLEWNNGTPRKTSRRTRANVFGCSIGSSASEIPRGN